MTTQSNGQGATPVPSNALATITVPQPSSISLVPYVDPAPGGKLPSVLEKAGFILPAAFTHPRIIADISGAEKTGKSYLALTSTQPIFYFLFDPIGISGVVEAFVRSGKRVVVRNFAFPRNASHDTYKRMYGEFLDAAELVAKNAPRGTIVIDSGAALHDLVRLNLYGKLTQVGTYKYEERNAEMESIFNLLADSKLNVLYLHPMRDEWLDKNRTGRQIPDRFEMLAYRVQMNLVTYREMTPVGNNQLVPGAFRMRVVSSRLASQMGGMDRLTPLGETDTIPQMMSFIFNRPAAEFA